MADAAAAGGTRWQRVAAAHRRVRAAAAARQADRHLLLLWPTLTALWLASGGRPPLALVVIVFTRRHAADALARAARSTTGPTARFDAHVERTRAATARARRDRAVGGAVPSARRSRWSRSCSSCSAPTARRCCWSVPALAIAIAYPFFKRFFALPQAFLGIAFSSASRWRTPPCCGNVPPIALVAARRSTCSGSIAYDTEYAMVDRDDDRRIGIRTSALTFGRFDVLAVAICYAIYLAGMAWIGLAVRARRRLLRRRCVVAAGFAALSPLADPRPRPRRAASARFSTITGSASRSSPASCSTTRCRSAWPRV